MNESCDKKNIIIVDFAAVSGGALSVLREYYDKAKNDLETNYIFLVNDYYFEETNNIKIKILKKEKKWLVRLLFDFFYGRFVINKLNPSEVISLQNTAIFGVRSPQTIYLHQSIPFQKIKKFSFFKKSEIKLAVIQYFIGSCIKMSLKSCDRIIVQTKWMKDAVVNDCKVKFDKIEVLCPDINDDLIPETTNIKSNCFFYPTSNEIYKNNDLIFEAVNLLNQEGIVDFKVDLTIDGDSSNCVNKIGKISREEVFERYCNSVLIFPSYIETFGLPLLEAKKCKTKILAADTCFAHEILDDYDDVYFFDPFDAVKLKELMKNLILKG